MWVEVDAHARNREVPLGSGPTPMVPSLGRLSVVCVCVSCPFYITRATGTLVNTPTNPDGGGGGICGGDTVIGTLPG